MFEAIAEVCNLYSPQECWNYFKAAGYDGVDAATFRHRNVPSWGRHSLVLERTHQYGTSYHHRP
jgi:hypothetical protein